jgi:hypothetical protein
MVSVIVLLKMIDPKKAEGLIWKTAMDARVRDKHLAEKGAGSPMDRRINEYLIASLLDGADRNFRYVVLEDVGDKINL